MLHCLLLTDDVESVDLLRRLAQTGTRQLLLAQVFCPMITGPQLQHALSTQALDLVLLDVSDLELAASIYLQIREGFPKMAVVAFARPGFEAPDIGDVPFLERPWSIEAVLQAARQTIHRLDSSRFENLFAFIPAKAGGGASTLAINTAGPLAHVLKQKVMLIECDLRSGVLSEILRVPVQVSTSELLRQSDHLTGEVWDRSVIATPSLDFILVGTKSAAYLPQWYDYRRLLTLASRRYEQVLIDLPEAINDGTAEIVRKASGVYIVVTPELPSFALARRRMDELRRAGAEDSCLHIVLNRWHPSGLQVDDVEEALGCHVDVVLPNDYRAVTDATLEGAFVPGDSVLGQTFRAFAGSLLGKNEPPDATKQTGAGGMLKRLWRS